MVMAASGFRAPTCLCSSSSSSSTAMKASISSSLSSSLSVSFHSKASRLSLFSLCPKGLFHFSPWSGLKHLGLSVTWRSSNFERRKGRDRVAYASLFGVGAPEALVIGVVALLVFGPKGLAEVARSLGKTLRAFQPTIRELQEVSRDFKSTLEKEIGLDDISSITPRSENYNATSSYTASSYPSTLESKTDADADADAKGTSSPSNAYTSEEYLKVTEEQLKAVTSSQSESKLETQENPQASADVVSSLNRDSATEEDSNSVGKPSVASPEEQEPQGKVSSPETIVKENDV